MYKVFIWHEGSKCLGEMTVEQIMNLGYAYIKFNKERMICSVTNCCDFRCH